MMKQERHGEGRSALIEIGCNMNLHSGRHDLPSIFDTHLSHFDEAVIAASHQHPVLVDFWAEWCPPCRMLTPILERVIHALGGQIRLAKIEVDEGDNMKLAGRYGLRGFPTVLLFVDGEIRGRFSSAKPEHWVREFIAEHTNIDV